MIGRRLSQYLILDRLGSGGMGEVYLAEDTKLGRKVAVKTLPPDFAEDRSRLARFTREARTLAALNHANIATLHGLEEADGTTFLVMECVEGDTLQERLREGAMPLDEALPVLVQTAEALEAAHRGGIVHRDLKPANIKITPEGNVKVLDFGLAKALEGPRPDHESEAGNSALATITRGETQEGVILGTAPYMSPEQARGQDVDKRTDIWAFGCLCYEVLTARRAFDGGTTTDTLAAIIHKDPDWERLPDAIPPEIRRVMRRCLKKDPRRRLHDIADARTEIEDYIADPDGSAEFAAPTRRTPAWPWVVAAAASVLLAFAGGRNLSDNVPAGPPPLPIRVGLPLSTEYRIGGLTNSVYQNPLAISPDGQTIVYVGQSEQSLLFVRRLDEFESRPLPGTEGAMQPFFSPDGEWIGFLTRNEIRKIALSGGAPQRVCDIPYHFFRGAVWGAQDSIVFNAEMSGLMRVSSNGGAPERLTTTGEGHAIHVPFQFLADGRLLYQRGRQLVVQELSSDTWEALDVPGWSESGMRRLSTRYLPSGHLLYPQSTGRGVSQLLAVSVDPTERTARGPALPVLEAVNTPQQHAFLAISDSGTLAFVPVEDDRPEIVRVTRSGSATTLTIDDTDDRFSDTHPRFSPDGNWVAIDIIGVDGKDIWKIDRRGTKTRLTFGGDHTASTWSPDGSRIAVSADHDLVAVSTDGSGELEMLWEEPTWQWPSSWSPDGKVLAFFELNSGTTGTDIGILPFGGEEPSTFLATDYAESGAVFSPDGRWIAYTSDESGRKEIYVRPFPGSGTKTLVSTTGGSEPSWSADGSEMFYRLGRKMMVVDVRGEPDFEADTPRVLFEGDYDLAPGGEQHYGVSPDGQEFVMVRLQPLPQLNVIVNWIEELKELVPTDD